MLLTLLGYLALLKRMVLSTLVLSSFSQRSQVTSLFRRICAMLGLETRQVAYVTRVI